MEFNSCIYALNESIIVSKSRASTYRPNGVRYKYRLGGEPPKFIYPKGYVFTNCEFKAFEEKYNTDDILTNSVYKTDLYGNFHFDDMLSSTIVVEDVEYVIIVAPKHGFSISNYKLVNGCTGRSDRYSLTRYKVYPISINQYFRDISKCSEFHHHSNNHNIHYAVNVIPKSFFESETLEVSIEDARRYIMDFESSRCGFSSEKLVYMTQHVCDDDMTHSVYNMVYDYIIHGDLRDYFDGKLLSEGTDEYEYNLESVRVLL